MARDYKSPGISYKETEELTSRLSVYNPYVAIVGGASKGPFSVTEIKTQKELKKIFGDALDIDYGVFAADYILEHECRVLYKRVKGSGASAGSTGTASEDKFTFTSRWYDTSLNGAVISLTFDKTAKTVEYKLTNGKVTLEHHKNLSYEEAGKNYLPRFLEEVGSVLVATATKDFDDEKVKDANLTLKGVDDGIATLTAKDYEDAAADFSNTETTTISIILVPGVTTTSVITKFASMAKERGDCVFLPDIPFGTTPETALTYVNGTDEGGTRLDNEWVGTYGPWVKVTDVTRSKPVWAPPSVVAAAVMVNSDSISGGCYVAAAGFSEGRGVVPHAIECEYELSKDQRDTWLGDGNVLNPIANFKGMGIAVFGNKTTKRPVEGQDESVYCSMNIRRMANYIRQLVIQVSMTELFNPNDSLTWASWKAKLNPLLKAIKDNRGLEDYKVVMDETTVTEDDVRMGQAPAVIYVKPIRALEFIPITFAVTENGVIFTDNQEG